MCRTYCSFSKEVKTKRCKVARKLTALSQQQCLFTRSSASNDVAKAILEVSAPRVAGEIRQRME